MTTPNIDLLLSDIEFRQGRAAKMLEVTVYDGDLVTRFDVVDIVDLIDEVRALREQRDAERAVIEAAKAWANARPDEFDKDHLLLDAIRALRALEGDA